MKIIFSRKGIDDAYGKGASPIMPDGRLLSIPIPTKRGEKGIPYSSLTEGNYNYTKILSHLGIKAGSRSCHLDPDLNDRQCERKPKWKPSFGQQGAAASHLINQGVGSGDLFLFFGTFRETEIKSRSKLSFIPHTPKRHIIFGYLQIDQVLDLHQREERMTALDSGYQDHPHLVNDYSNKNYLFTSNRAGTFKYHQNLVLTHSGSSKSIWSLPPFFADLKISRHQNRERYGLIEGRLLLKTVGIGQDFVVEENQKVAEWADKLIKSTPIA